MKKVVCFILAMLTINSIIINSGNVTFASEIEHYSFACSGEIIKVPEAEIKLPINNYGKTDKELLIQIYNMGFSKTEAVKYVFGNINETIKLIKYKLDRNPINSEVVINNWVANATKDQDGRLLDEEDFLNQFYDMVISEKRLMNLSFIPISANYKYEEVKNWTNKKADFTTYIYGENQEGRIQNIKTALQKLNGFKLEPNQKLSFNKVVGDTTIENGYTNAKIIVKGKFVDGIGGGVCQSATTLYNACLLAGLDVRSVSPHSLKVGYTKSSFDAMVSFGSSDLVIKNNLETPIFIFTECNGEYARVVIYGEKNEYEIKRRSESVEFDKEKFVDIAEKSIGYLEYYKDGQFAFEKKIRSDTYYLPKIV